jgi:peptidoglycan L-alanyl-D-glutamate endopeptidase CwlK
LDSAPNTWALNARSRERLHGVHSDLVLVVQRAMAWTECDFRVTEGLRSLDRQKQLVADGKSQTHNSRHLTGHAVDVAAVIQGRVSWDWPHYFLIADAFRKAANELDIPIIWGGAWRRTLNGDVSAQKLQRAYREECTRAGRVPFLDGPHFELDRRKYP